MTQSLWNLMGAHTLFMPKDKLNRVNDYDLKKADEKKRIEDGEEPEQPRVQFNFPRRFAGGRGQDDTTPAIIDDEEVAEAAGVQEHSAWLKDRAKPKDPTLEKTPEKATARSLWHYGRDHWYDYYEPLLLPERAAAERAVLRQAGKEREEGMASRIGSPPTKWELDESRYTLTKQLQRLDSHMRKVAVIHRRLRECAQQEESYVYQPGDHVVTNYVSFERWKEVELERLVRRRTEQIAVDRRRPDMNRRTPPGNWLERVSTGMMPGRASGFTEPSQWPRRRWYYPATDFATLNNQYEKPEEELMLEKRIGEAQWRLTGMWMMGSMSLCIGFMITKKVTIYPMLPIASAFCMGSFLELTAGVGKAWRETQDLDDFLVAKHVWFAKNRPEKFSAVRLSPESIDIGRNVFKPGKQAKGTSEAPKGGYFGGFGGFPESLDGIRGGTGEEALT